MSILTENSVLSRTRAQDLKSVRKLNCWGSELGDVSIVRKMPNVEVLSLSVNNIRTLADFAHCQNLQELYIRKNQIQDLNEVLFLQELPKLKNLWLADNPCSEHEKYRLSVLKALPNLQKLDNQSVQPEEVDRARIYGETLSPPTEAAKVSPEEEAQPPPPPVNRVVQNGGEKRVESLRPKELELASVCEPNVKQPQNIPPPSPAVSAPRELVEDVSETELRPDDRSQRAPNIPNASSGQSSGPSSISSNDPPPPQQVIHSSQISPHQQHAFQARVQTLMDHSGRRLRKGTDITCDPSGFLVEENLLPGQNSLMESRRYSSVEFLHGYSVDDGLMSPADGCRHDYRVLTDAHRMEQQRGSSGLPKTEKNSPTRILPKGGKNRNANILSAVLCLIKELDYASLEVVETAIHCRMEEMDD